MEKYKILKDLVGFNTIKDKENKEIIEYIEKYLLGFGFKTDYKDKNLIMSYGKNPSVGFLGHTDTVEYIEGWKTDPFVVTAKDGKLYGLGVCDMKGGIAAILDAISKVNLKTLKNGLKLFFTFDEEVGFGGIKNVVKLNVDAPEVMIFGEPTNNEVLVGSKGLLEYKVSFNGIKAHSSNPEKGKSANMKAIKFVAELDDFYNENIKGFENKNYEIPYTTMNVGLINGGSAVNSVSAKCDIAMDFRIAKKEHIYMLRNKVNVLAQKYDAKTEIVESIEPFISETELTDKIKTANFMTEASFFNNKSRIILGTGPVTAHEVNEYITEESYEKLVGQYVEVIEKHG